MSLVWRKIQRANKKSTKYLFTITPQELLIVGSSKFQPESIVIACMHRRRRIEGKERKWEGSFADPHRSLIVWPASASDSLRIETTLYGKAMTGEYDDKDWTVIVEEITRKRKRHPIAALSLNMRLFIQNSTETTAELKLKLRPLQSEVVQCLLQVTIISRLISEHDKAMQSEISSVSEGKAVIPDIKTRKDERLISTSSAGSPEKLGFEESSSLQGHHEPKEDDAMTKELDKHDISPKDLFTTQTSSNMSLKSFELESLPVTIDNASGNLSNSLPHATPVGDAVKKRDNMALQIKPLTKIRSLDLSDNKSIDEGVVMEKILPPEVIEDEDLLTWCQRIIKNYPSVKISDFKKSFRSGLAFCAIIHRFRPGLIGDFDHLDFTEGGRKENFRKAFAAAKTLGVNINLDLNQMMVLSPEANEESVCSFLFSLRNVLEGKVRSSCLTNMKASDHRRSASYNISESEALVMKELEKLRKQREDEEALDFSDALDKPLLSSSDAGNNVDGKGSFGQNFMGKNNSHVDFDSDEPYLEDVYEKDDYFIAGLVSPTVATRHEELKKKRQVLKNSGLEVATATTDTERARRLRKEARRLMENAALEGKTTLLNSAFSVPSTSSQANLSSGSFKPIEPKSDLRCLEVVTPPVNIYNFKKVQPSPNIQRKKYNAPIIPAFQLPSQRLSTSSSDICGTASTTFDRVKRYGSMRSQELAETVAKMAGLAPAPTPSVSSTEATPTRKLVSQWEKYNSNVGKIEEEQSMVSARLIEVSKKDEKILTELKNTIASSDEEENLLREHMQLLNEKDALVRKSEYLNILEQLADVEQNIARLQKELGKTSSLEEAKTEDDKKSIDKMMEDLLELVNKKDQLSQKLIQQEAEDEEMNDRNRRTLEAAANFKRGFEQPVSASKRLITWFRSEITG